MAARWQHRHLLRPSLTMQTNALTWEPVVVSRLMCDGLAPVDVRHLALIVVVLPGPRGPFLAYLLRVGADDGLQELVVMPDLGQLACQVHVNDLAGAVLADAELLPADRDDAVR